MTSPFRPVLEQTLTHALAYLERLEQAPVGATVEISELRQRLGRRLPDAGTAATQVIDALVADTAGGLIGSMGGRFLAGSLAERSPPPWPPTGSRQPGIKTRRARPAAEPPP